jgi:AraC-like DNA-binding protein
MPGPVHTVALEAAPGAWTLDQASPTADLAGLVEEYWEVQGQLDSFREALLPNGFVELMINLGPPHQVHSDQAPGWWERSWYSGLQERALLIESASGTHLVSARLHPLGAWQLLGPWVAGVANSIVDLEAALGMDGRVLRERLRAAGSPVERFQLLEHFLTARARCSSVTLPLVQQAAARIEAAHGHLRISTLHEGLGTSRKHLSVSFTRHLGLTAKSYARIHRFVWTLARLRENENVEWSQLAIAAGYSDQSHLARDFQRVGGASPTEYLRRSLPDVTALLTDG